MKWTPQVTKRLTGQPIGCNKQARTRVLRNILPRKLAAPAGGLGRIHENRELGQMVWRVVKGALEVEMGLARSAVEVYSGEENQLRVELVASGQVIGFTISGERANSLDYLGRVSSEAGAKAANGFSPMERRGVEPPELVNSVQGQLKTFWQA